MTPLTSKLSSWTRLGTVRAQFRETPNRQPSTNNSGLTHLDRKREQSSRRTDPRTIDLTSRHDTRRMQSRWLEALATPTRVQVHRKAGSNRHGSLPDRPRAAEAQRVRGDRQRKIAQQPLRHHKFAGRRRPCHPLLLHPGKSEPRRRSVEELWGIGGGRHCRKPSGQYLPTTAKEHNGTIVR
jgi:hypothetical protein